MVVVLFGEWFGDYVMEFWVLWNVVRLEEWSVFDFLVNYEIVLLWFGVLFCEGWVEVVKLEFCFLVGLNKKGVGMKLEVLFEMI